MNGTGVLSTPRVIPIDTKNGKYSVSFSVSNNGAVANDFITVPNIGHAQYGTLAVFNAASLKIQSLPPFNNVQGVINWKTAAGANLTGAFLIYVPSTGEVIAISPRNPSQPAAQNIDSLTSFSVEILPCEEIWFIKLADTGQANQSQADIVVSTFDRETYLQGV